MPRSNSKVKRPSFFDKCEELQTLEREVKRIKRQKLPENYCALDDWYNYIKPVMCNIVGYGAQNPELKNSSSYDAAYEYLLGLLPACKHESYICPTTSADYGPITSSPEEFAKLVEMKMALRNARKRH